MKSSVEQAIEDRMVRPRFKACHEFLEVLEWIGTSRSELGISRDVLLEVSAVSPEEFDAIEMGLEFRPESVTAYLAALVGELDRMLRERDRETMKQAARRHFKEHTPHRIEEAKLRVRRAQEHIFDGPVCSA